MRHRRKGRKLGRNASHRLALFRNLSMALIRHERIITTVPKAKELRTFVEKLITLARKGTLHHRRLAASRLGPMADAEVNPEGEAAEDHRTVLQKLFDDIGPRFKDRPGGYTRIIKRHEVRLGDAGKTAFIELLKEGETRARSKPAAPAAPRVVEEPKTEPTVEATPPAAEQAAAESAPASEAPASGEAPPAQEPPKE